jgi:putative ABC transport system permease protein
LAFGLIRLLLRIGSDQLPRNQNITINLYVLLFTLLITVAASIVFGLAPALALIRDHRAAGLAGGSRATQFLRRPRRNLLIVSEVGLSLVLIIGSGLLLRSLSKLVHADLGFEPEQLFATSMRLPNEDPTVAGFYQKLLVEAPQLPGVQAAAVADCVPGMASASANLSFPDRAADPAYVPTASGCWISADYFRATGTPLLSGREFNDHDNRDGPPVAIINQALARRYWPNQDAIGKFLAVGYLGPGRRTNGSEKLRQVVGVVADVKRLGEPAEPGAYMPYTQDETSHVLWLMTLYVKSKGTGDVPAEIRAKLRSLRPDLPVSVQSMDTKLSQTLASRRFTLFLLSGFALLALLLAAIGIHGVVAYSVSRRRREIGVRMALGAARESVVAMILKEVLRMVAAGLLAGAIAALACSRFITNMLYGTRAADPLVLISCAAIMLAVATGAAWLPACRAASIDPMDALRSE